MANKKEALQYIRDNNNWTEAQIERAFEIMEQFRCPISQADENIEWDIQQMMEDYAFDNDLEKDWWYSVFDDADDVWSQLW